MTWKVHGHKDLLQKTRFWGVRKLNEFNGPVVEHHELNPISLKEEFGMLDLVCKFDYLEESNSVTLLMIHDDLDEIASQQILLKQYLQTPQQPLTLAFNKFHAWRRIEEFLTDPQSYPDLFETAILWIFTLLGWQGFQLSADKKGSSELLEEEFGRQPRRSSDILLLNDQGKLVVLSLTSSLKDVAAKAQSIKNTANRLGEMLNCSVSSAVIVSDTVDVMRNNFKPIPVIGLNELKELWPQVKVGNLAQGNAILTKLFQS